MTQTQTGGLSRGSEWRRWDLHIHTPGTALNDQFGSWSDFLTAVEAHPTVKVIGITDYLSIENYSRVAQLKSEGRLSNIDFILPNIEFRIAPQTEKNTAVNIHILIDPSQSDHVERISQSLTRLSYRYNGDNFSCVRTGLTQLGRAIDPQAKSDESAYTTGVKQFRVDFSDLRNWYEGEGWLRANSLVAVAASLDGLSGFSTTGGWAAYRQEITRFSRIVFSGRPGERDFWLGKGDQASKEAMQKLGGPKPCVHGSDAHAMDKLFNPDQDRFCWIKSEPTFEGLRQIIYEPEDRIFVGRSAPNLHDAARVISSVTVSKSNGWFPETTLPLNSQLVSIVGRKGAGKSALAELISFAAGSWDGSDQNCFIRRARTHISGVEVMLSWANGSESRISLDGGFSSDGRVRYLSQNFVERLCAEDSVGSELVREVEAVVFAHIDPSETLNASNFEELRRLRTSDTQSAGERIRSEIKNLIREEILLREEIETLDAKRERLATLKLERDGLEAQMPSPASPAEAESRAQIGELRDGVANAQERIAALKIKMQKVRSVKSRAIELQSYIAHVYEEIEPILGDIGISINDRELLKPVFIADFKTPLDRRMTEIGSEIESIEGDLLAPDRSSLRGLQNRLDAALAIETMDKARDEKVRTIQNRVAAVDAEMRKINIEIERIDGLQRDKLAKSRLKRQDSYVEYFDNLKKEKELLEELYSPVRRRLVGGNSSTQEQQLEFSIRWHVDIESWLERGSNLFDQRRAIPYGTIGNLADSARDKLLPAWISGDPAAIRAAMLEFMDPFEKSNLSPVQYFRSNVTLQDALDWLYEVDHIRLGYGLRYNGIDLANLSPGTKGIVLLILYLGLDERDTRPLIVDQPDENLDNESIYELLTAYFRTAKKRRQIILITHNPNLVVNSDSEQIVVAEVERGENNLPRISYWSGGLESSSQQKGGVREHVCRVLEGGHEAFRRREERYRVIRAGNKV